MIELRESRPNLPIMLVALAVCLMASAVAVTAQHRWQRSQGVNISQGSESPPIAVYVVHAWGVYVYDAAGKCVAYQLWLVWSDGHVETRTCSKDLSECGPWMELP